MPGCGATGTEQFSYVDAPGGSTNQAITYTTVDGTCATGYQLSFDYRIEGNSGTDYAEVVYSTDGGSSWTVIGGELAASLSWTTLSIPLPALLDGTSFELGFRFTYDDNTINGVPLATDNILVTGTDNINPVITCPATADLAVDFSCSAIMDDFTKSMITLSDNCTDSVDIVVTQDIPEFTVLGGGPGSTQTITLTAVDESGNSSQCSIDLLIIDNFNPSIACPADTSIYVDASCNGTVPDYTGEVTASDNCTSVGNLIYTQSPTIGTTISGSGVSTVITITVEDESGNTASCNFNAVTVDTMVATISCPSDMDLYVDNNCEATLSDYTGLAVVADNCISVGSLSVSQSPPAGTTISAAQVITLTVTGGDPSTPQSCTFNANIIDTIAPGIICPTPVDLYVDASCSVPLTDYTGMPVITENCGGPYTIDQFPLPGTSVSVGADVIVFLTVTDTSGNSKQCQFVQPVYDNIAPVITCPADQLENADPSCTATLGDYSSLLSASDNCTPFVNLTITQTPAAGTLITGPTTVTFTVDDDNGNSSSCSFTVDIEDVTPPTITCPANFTISTNNGCDYQLDDYTPSVTVSDNCSGTFTYLQSPAAGTLLAVGVHTIQITVTDESGNSSNCSFDITVEDQVGPTITTCASNQTILSDANCEAQIGDYTGMVVASDNCSAAGNLTVAQSPAPGTTISTNTIVTLTVTDESGNSTDCQFSVSLQDNIAPVVTCPGDQIMTINGSCQYTVPDLSGMITGTDNCSAFANMTVIQSPVAGSTDGGITNVLVTLYDEQGNSSTCTTTLLPDDNDPPTITCPSPGPVDNGTNCDFTVPNYISGALVLDNCPNYTLSQNPAIGSTINPGMNDITITVVDAGGNSASCTFTLEVTENTAPSITCPGDVSTCDPVVTYSDPTYSDNCFAFLTQTDMTGYTSGDTFPVGTTILEYTVADSSGNTATCSFNIEILPYPSPAIVTDDTVFVCDATSGILSADPIAYGNGEWTLLSGTGSINNQFANVTGVNNLTYGENEFIWTVSTASCGSLSDTMMIIASQAPLPATIQTDTMYTCDDPQVTLNANAPVFGSGEWTTNMGAVIADPNSFNTTATIINSGWQMFTYTVTSGGCPPSSDSLMIFASFPPVIDHNDTTLCLGSDSLTVTASVPIENQTSYWFFLNGGGNIENPGQVTTNVNNFELGTNWLVYAIEHPECPTVYDTLLVVNNLCDDFDPVIPTVITPNFDGVNDIFVIANLEVVYPECEVIIFNRWGSVVFESVGYAAPWDGTYKGEPLPMGTYFYKIYLNDEENRIITGDISIIH